ncbi:membrane protein insertase YidC [Actinoallomurus bryophytorum]|uniref:Membrane protein insertase YidC n=1 Tax=Actinoallomurus bryophytorum TaxID=1490222 RepID=A0A543CWE9_9ACTN|nr:membrane protein insertase YidC [Actinoallomurus bryophytorum]TQM01391.1 YidC/Oxa1 family membrane protein insertase [Actinoallomurus bryophytorum]
MSHLWDAAVGVAYDLVTGLTSALTPVAGGLAAAVAIVVFTACVRLALLPLSRRQARAGQARLRLEPRARKIRERHRADPVRAHQELAALYRAEGTSMWAGIGPSLLQLPVFSVVYRMFLSPAVGGHANLLLAHTLLGAPLGERWLFGAGAFGPHGLVFLALFAALAVVGWWTSRTMYRYQAPPPGALGKVMRVVPFTTLAVAAYVPLAAGLYLLTTTIWTAAERALLWRGPVTA